MGSINKTPQGTAHLTADISAKLNDDNPAAYAFIQRWQGTTASELSTAQSFVSDLCALLGVDKPHATPAQDYMFERPVTFRYGDGSSSAGRIDCYKRGHFVLEAKKQKKGAHTKGFDDGLLRAHKQGEGYVRALPASDGRPPFVLVVDVGTVIEVFAEFSMSGGTYIPFPDPRSHRLQLADLARPEIRQRLRQIWLEPDSLNPARISAEVTREVAKLLAQLAKSLETPAPTLAENFKQSAPEIIASYLTRCLFSMFAEDVELLPKGAFIGLLKTHRDAPATLQQMLRLLWADMDIGGFSAALAKPVLKFNGKLFKNSGADGYSLLLKPEQIDLLIAAAQANWREVEPAIFGTLLERALDPTERHALGAHYTPRAYVERLVLPTVIEPLRADWAIAQAAALVLAHEAAELEAHPVEVKSKADFPAADRHAAAVRAKWREARQWVKAFHHQLCSVRVLDPACGSGNFLYVTLEHLKRLEGEVINQLGDLGEGQASLGFGGETVTLQQLRGIELNERAAALAELVLWIGYLQWHIRTQGLGSVAEPVVHDYGNIECRDAVLAYDRQALALDSSGKPITRWDGKTFKTHAATGDGVPDESAQVPQWNYLNPRRAEWPQVDFVVGNPPFIGKLKMREALGDGYVTTLRDVYPAVPDSADFVMYWWHKAAETVANGNARQFGLITTNSLSMTYNRRVVGSHLSGKPPIHLAFAIPDHPWVDSAQGAAVRIAMTVGAAGNGEGVFQSVVSEIASDTDDFTVAVAERYGVIHETLTLGANVSRAQRLASNSRVSAMGMILVGAGFIVEPGDPLLDIEPNRIRPYLNGKDLTQRSRGVHVIDLYGLTLEEVRAQFPACFQRLYERVKPERDVSNDKSLRENWWLFRRTNIQLRQAIAGLYRYIGTTETAKHRLFSFISGSVTPDQKIRVIGSDDALMLGVLSSVVHVDWAFAAGGRLGVGNDPVYNNTSCFETFAFPTDDTGLTPELAERIRTRAEQLDAHRKARQAAHASITLTGLYNVLEKLRRNEVLSPKEKMLHEQGLVSVLRTLHDELDAAVLQAYGWSDLGSVPWDDGTTRQVWTETLLERLVALNAKRVLEEAAGTIRWLRPAFQNPQKTLSNNELLQHVNHALELDLLDENLSQIGSAATQAAPAVKPAGSAAQAWPATLPEQVRAVAQVLTSSAVPLTLAALEAHFKGRGPWKKGLPMLLQTLEAVGRAQQVAVDGAVGWRA